MLPTVLPPSVLRSDGSIQTQRAMGSTTDLFQPLEDCIQSEFLLTIHGKNLSSHEQAILSLPVKFGALIVPNPVVEAD